jgi:hypothetical protein
MARNKRQLRAVHGLSRMLAHESGIDRTYVKAACRPD